MSQTKKQEKNKLISHIIVKRMHDPGDILLINRDEGFLETTARYLSDAGYLTYSAMNMREALSILSLKPIGLIICDNEVQDISGFEFLRFLKNDPLREAIPFILFVPVHDQGRAAKAFQVGVADFMVYPMEMDVFVERIKEIMDANEYDKIRNAAPQPIEKKRDSNPDKRRHTRKKPVPNLNIQLSRDGILWIAGIIKNYSKEGIFISTSMLGKKGLSITITMPLANGNITAEGEIVRVSFDDYNHPLGMGICFTVESDWKIIFDYLESILEVRKKKEVDSPEQVLLANHNDETVIMSDNTGVEIDDALIADHDDGESVSYNKRFYNSLTGKQLDNYKIISLIGTGSMGGVFKAIDPALEREVALKVISYDLSSKENFRKMFIKEARIISKLNHPNIAQIYSIGNQNYILYFAMEFISGLTLKDLIKKNINLNTIKGIDYLIDICRTLEFVKQKNILHRDIKPENILINSSGILKIVDFGVAIKTDADGEKQADMVGSPYYISPDAILGRMIDHRSDIYSLGATYYHALSSAPPFDGKDTEEVLLKHLNEKPVPLHEKNPKVSNLLGSIIDKMLLKDPDERYQDYQEIIKDLQNFRVKVLTSLKRK